MLNLDELIVAGGDRAVFHKSLKDKIAHQGQGDDAIKFHTPNVLARTKKSST